MVLINGFNGVGKHVPDFGFDVSIDISANHPDDVGAIFVTVGEKSTISLGFFHIHFSTFYQPAPDADHADINPSAGGGIDDKVHMIPISIYTRSVDIGEIKSIRHRRLSIKVHGRYSVDGLYLYYVEACLFALFKIVFRFIPVQPFGKQPTGISEPEEGRAIRMLKVTGVAGYLQGSIFPREVV